MMVLSNCGMLNQVESYFIKILSKILLEVIKINKLKLSRCYGDCFIELQQRFFGDFYYRGEGKVQESIVRERKS